jgi:hypothetical protein
MDGGLISTEPEGSYAISLDRRGIGVIKPSDHDPVVITHMPPGQRIWNQRLWLKEYLPNRYILLTVGSEIYVRDLK